MTKLRLNIPIVLFVMTFPVGGFGADYVPGEIIVKMKASSSTSSKHQFIGKASLEHKMSLKKSWTKFNMHQFSLKPGQSVEQAVLEMNQDPDVEYAEPNYTFQKQSVGIEGNALSASEMQACLLYTSPSPRDRQKSRMPSSA